VTDGRDLQQQQQQQQQQQHNMMMMPTIRPWVCQYDNNVRQQLQQPSMNAVGTPPGSMHSQFRTPPQPPIVPVLAPNLYQQQQQQQQQQHKPQSGINDWGSLAIDERQQPPSQQQLQPYVPENDFRAAEVYGEGSDDEDDRQAEFDNNFHKRFNDASVGPPVMMRRGPPGQDFRDQQTAGVFGPNRG